MHFVVDNVAGSAEVDGVDDLVVSVVFVAVEILGSATVPCRVLADGQIIAKGGIPE
jgi:hypothetical protein